jgi:hypothetical protein
VPPQVPSAPPLLDQVRTAISTPPVLTVRGWRNLRSRGLLTVCMGCTTCVDRQQPMQSKLSTEAYPISTLTNRCSDAVGRDGVRRQHALR